MKKLSDDLYGFTDNMHERALALEDEIDALKADKEDALSIRFDWDRAHELLDDHGVLTSGHLVERLRPVLKVWEAIGISPGQSCADLKLLCNNTGPEVIEAFRVYVAAHRSAEEAS